METYKLETQSRLSVATLIARVEAGLPMACASDFEKIDLNALFGGESSLLIRIRGESMLDTIRDGDWVLINKSRRPVSGNIVLAQLGDAFTVKIFETDERRGLRLAPKNGHFPTRDVTEDDEFQIVGVVVWIFAQAPLT